MGCKVVRFGDIIKLEDALRMPLSSREREDRKGIYPYYGAQGIVDRLNDYTYEGEYLLVAEDGENLRSRKAPIANSVRGRFRVNNHAHVIAKSEKYNLIYLRHLLNSTDISAYVTGSTQPKLSQASLLSMELPIPSVEEQNLVAKVLDSFDNKIELNNQINGYLYELCLSELNSVLSNSEEMGVVDDFCKSLYSGGTPATSKAEYWNGDLPWLSSGETRQRFIIDTEKSITQLGVEKSSTKLAHSGDIVMASAGQGFTRGQTSMLFFDTYVNQSVLVLHPKPNAGSYLFLQLAKSYDMLRAWSDSTSTRGSISGKLLRQFKLPLLDGPQLEELENFCSPHFKLIESNLRETKTLTALRDVLLPKLMAGEIDVSEIDLTQLNSHLSDHSAAIREINNSTIAETTFINRFIALRMLFEKLSHGIRHAFDILG